MTQFSKDEVINNLRRKVKELEDKLKAITDWYKHVDLADDWAISIQKLGEILGVKE